MGGVEFWKGHGTHNDFVLVPDPGGMLTLTPARVRALCDRRGGLGADGVLRVVRASNVADAPSTVDEESWFMDYRNADGSLAEMCGNGVRLFARYLVTTGWVGTSEFVVGTRSGPRSVRVDPGGPVTVDMGPASVFGISRARLGGREFDGVAVDVGNPHLACVTDLAVTELDVSLPPHCDPALFPQGVNVEFVNRVGAGRLRMRVHERGVGETMSCGTGTVAAAVAALHGTGDTEGETDVDVPGGRVRVGVRDGYATLTGPAILVAHGEIDRSWWDATGDEGALAHSASVG